MDSPFAQRSEIPLSALSLIAKPSGKHRSNTKLTHRL